MSAEPRPPPGPCGRALDEEAARLGYSQEAADVVFWVARSKHEAALPRALHAAGASAVDAVVAADLVGGVSAALDVIRALALPGVKVDALGASVPGAQGGEP